MKLALLASLAAVSIAFGGIPSADAAIRCNGAYQINSLGQFHSPFCEDEYLAQVARSRGIRVTGAQIRASLSVKGDVCRTIGIDSRVYETCHQYIRRNRDCRFEPC